jgi:metal-sulfur cluster biosynthetic enzyme
MTDTRSYEDVSTDPPEAQGRPSDLVKDDLPDTVGSEQSEQLDDQRLLEDIEEALKDVVDPELGINVVDLGRSMACTRRRRFLDHRYDTDLGACPLTDVIEDQTQTALEGLVDRG